MIAIGQPGAPPRIQLRCSLDKASKYLAEGEVALEVAGVGDYLIAADGQSIGLRPVLLEEQRERLWSRVKLLRARAEGAGCATPAGIVQTDAASMSRIAAAALDASIAQAAGQLYSVSWTMADNTSVALDAAGMIAIGAAVSQHMTDCHVRSQTLRSQIEAADLSSISAIDIEAGWPA